VTFEPIPAVCADAAPFALTGALPEGGVFSGNGVVDGMFYPDQTGPGTFEITYTFVDGNGCQADSMQTVDVNPLPVVELGEDQETCTGGTVVFDAGAGLSSYLWSDGSAGQTLTTGLAGEYSVIVTNEFGCTAYDTVSLSVNPYPGKAGIPVGPAVIDLYFEPSSAFSSAGAENAATYTWMLEPAAAGSISGDVLDATVNWAPGFIGNAFISVMASNDCGDGEISDTITVQVYSTQGIGENRIGAIRVYPNPNQGTFTLSIQTEGSKSLDVSIMNALGETLWSQNKLAVNGAFSKVISLSETAAGMLILKVEEGRESWQGKIFIEK
jgi:hypothetical protein